MTGDEFCSLMEKARLADSHAEASLFNHYVVALTRLARARLSSQFNRRLDAEDIVQSVYHSFFSQVRDGRFEVRTSGDVWRFLAVLTIRTVNRQVQWHTVQKRSVHAERDTSAYRVALRQPPKVSARGAAPDTLAEMFDELSHLFATRPASHRAIVELRLSGEPIHAIASSMTCCPRTVHRVLARFKQDFQDRFAI